MMQALAQFLFGVILERFQEGALWFAAGLGFAAFVALKLLRGRVAASAQSQVMLAGESFI